MSHYKRAILIVLDGFGAGETKDASLFGDQGAYTSRRILQAHPEIHATFLTNYQLLALSHSNVLVPQNPNKDTLSGLYELMGITYPKLPTFPEGFSVTDIKNIESLISRKIIGNYPASGTKIIHDLGKDHISSGNLIAYTSQDSVFQLAAHQEVVSVSSLYYYCKLIRSYFDSKLPVGRIIARPFLGSEPNNFYRTPYRKDFPWIHPQKHLLHDLKNQQIKLIGNHVVQQLFPSLLDQVLPGKNDIECMKNLLFNFSQTPRQTTFYFIDLEDLDMLYAHRRDIKSYAQALESLDVIFQQLFASMNADDLLVFTADHGNDPGFLLHTDHTREKVPYLFLNSKGEMQSHGEVKGMSFIAQQLLHFFSSG